MIVDALRNGRSGGAMQSFADRLSASDMTALAAYVVTAFVECQDENTRYHTVANGWPDHERRYGAAFPFATGEQAVDAPEHALSDADRDGLALFRSSCTTCHEGRVDGSEARRTFRRASASLDEAKVRLVSAASSDAHADEHEDGHEEHVDDYDTPTIHDISPVIEDLSETEKLGERLYADACELCHAADGSGQNWIGAFLEPSPTDFTSDDFADAFDVERFIRSSLDAKAGTTMPSFRGALTEAQMRAVAQYVRRAFVEDGSHAQ